VNVVFFRPNSENRVVNDTLLAVYLPRFISDKMDMDKINNPIWESEDWPPLLFKVHLIKFCYSNLDHWIRDKRFDLFEKSEKREWRERKTHLSRLKSIQQLIGITELYYHEESRRIRILIFKKYFFRQLTSPKVLK
jgi:hypothetical protein